MPTAPCCRSQAWVPTRHWTLHPHHAGVRLASVCLRFSQLGADKAAVRVAGGGNSRMALPSNCRSALSSMGCQPMVGSRGCQTLVHQELQLPAPRCMREKTSSTRSGWPARSHADSRRLKDTAVGAAPERRMAAITAQAASHFPPEAQGHAHLQRMSVSRFKHQPSAVTHAAGSKRG